MNLASKTTALITIALGAVGCANSTLLAPDLSHRSIASVSVDEGKLFTTVDRGVKNLQALRVKDAEGEYWVMPGRLGLHFSSQYLLLSRWLGRKTTLLSEMTLKNYLFKDQLPDGSWLQVKDANRVEGYLDGTIFDYWALKVLRPKFPQEKAEFDQRLTRAGDFIRAKGGLEKASMFTKVALALFGNCPWEEIPYTPLTIFQKPFDKFTVKQFSQWVIPHLRPLAYMRRQQITKDLGPDYSLSELYLGDGHWGLKKFFNIIPHKLALAWGNFSKDTEYLVEEIILKKQMPRGSWGGYTLSTLFSVISIQDYMQARGDQLSIEKRQAMNEAIEKGITFVEKLYFQSGESSYYGVLDDGSYWDTMLALRALVENGVPHDGLFAPAKFIEKQQQEDGSVSFGYDFWNFGDVDDAAESMIALKRIGGFDSFLEKARGFILKRQNSDHGWGAFNKNNTGNLLVRLTSQGVNDSADLFDESSPDVAGHALEALGTLGMRPSDKGSLQGAINYLKDSREDDIAAWQARWGVNTIFGTTAVIGGLVKMGVPVSDPLIRDSMLWLKSIQNDDGGFGESAQSYLAPSWRGRGISTASQTGWALSALVDGGEGDSPEAHSAVNYLISQMEERGRWLDPSVTGTGHPGLLYLEYPVYPYTFPLMGIGSFIRNQCKISGGKFGGDAERCARYLKD